MKFLVLAASVGLIPIVVKCAFQDVAGPTFINRRGYEDIQSKACTKGTDNWGNCVEADRVPTTIRASANDTDDISADLLTGLQKANNGGLLSLEKGKKYVIGKKLDLSFLKDVYIKLDGELKFTDDIAYWQKNYFYYPFQKSITWVVWGGKDIKIYGSGTMNGNGQAWYDGFSGKEILDANNTYYRPILFLTDNATNVEVTGIKFLNSPCWSTFMVRTKNVAFDRCRFDAFSTNANRPKNTDGFDTLNVDGFRVTNSELDVGDDCISPKPNTTNIHIENVWCNNTHGVSMGSIGQYPDTLDYITNAYIKNVTLLNGQTGARLKAWAGPKVGYGYMRNITYEDITIKNTDQPIVLDQCYINITPSICAQYPSRVNISDVSFINVRGTSSGKRGTTVINLKCSPGAECKNIALKDINITSPKGAGVVVCDNIKGGIGIPCVSSIEAAKTKDGGAKVDDKLNP